MKTIDLHGIKHKDVEKVVIEAVCGNEVPLRIITGNSKRMKKLVSEALEYFDLKTREEIGNSGCLIVEKRKRK